MMNASTAAAAAAAEQEGTIASILLSLPDENGGDDDDVNPNYNYDSINSVDVQKSITAIKGSSSFETTASPNSVATSPSILNNLRKSHQSKNSRQRPLSSSSSSSISRRRCTTDAGVSISLPDLNNSIINTIGGHDSRKLINYTDEDRRSFLSRRCPTGHDSRILIDYKNVDDDNDDDGNDQNENEDQNNDQQRGKTKRESRKNDDAEQVQLQAQLQRRNSNNSAVQVQVQQQRRSSSHRVVRFSRKVTVREVRSHHDYTPRQIKKCWYQEDEVDQIKLKCLRILKHQEQKQRREQQSIIKEEEEEESSTSRNNEEDEDEDSINNDIDRNFEGKENYVVDDDEEQQHEEYCLRGLESYEPLAYTHRTRLRNKAQQIVFDINDQSYGADYCNEMIAEYYSNITSNCSLVAHIIGLQDERDAYA